MKIDVIDLGLCDFKEAYALQKKRVCARRRGEVPDAIFLVEHPDIYTLGRKSSGPILAKPAIEIERGGEVTFHNPGQLVLYPILYLEEGRRDLHKYLRKLEETLHHLLGIYGIDSESRAGATGVWTLSGRKIASIGVAVRGWVTFHGLALNVRNDLHGFGRIMPCGFSPDIMTSMQEELGSHCPSMSEVKRQLVESFLAEFSYEAPLLFRQPSVFGDDVRTSICGEV